MSRASSDHGRVSRFCSNLELHIFAIFALGPKGLFKILKDLPSGLERGLERGRYIVREGD